MAIVRNLMVRAGADFSGLQRGMQQATRQMNDFHRTLSGTVKKIGETLATIGVGMGIGSAIKDAMGYEAALQQINRIMGSNSTEFNKWANANASSFGMARSEAIKYGAVFGNLVSGFSSGTAETTQRTEALLKASAVVASSTGRSMDDVMERIRSGLLGNTESIEDLGINVNVAMIESTKAFQQFANGKSWQQLDFQTQSQIRLMAILEQANVKYGDSLNQNTATNMAMFVAQLNNIKLSIGQAFLPILNVVLPVLTVFATKLANVMSIVAQFSQALFGKGSAAKQQAAQAKATAQQAVAVGGLGNALKKTGSAAKQAGKDAKGSLAGFDEINQLSDSASSGGGGAGVDAGSAGGGGGEIPAPDTGPADSAISKISAKVKAFADKVKGFFRDVAAFVSDNKDIIISAVAGILAGFASFAIISNWSAIVEGFAVAIDAIGVALVAISWPIVAVAALIALFVGNLVYLWRTNEKFRDSVLEIWGEIKAFVSKVVSDMWSIAKSVWDKYSSSIVNGVKGFMKSIQDIIYNLWESFLKPIMKSGLEMLNTLWDKHLKGLVSQVVTFVAKLVSSALEIWNKFISPIVNWLIKTLGPIFASVFGGIFKVIGTIVGVASDVAKNLFKSLGGIVDFITGVFTGNWKKAWNGVKDIFGGVFGGLYALVKTPLNWIIDAVNTLISGLNKINIKTPDWVPGLGGKSFGINIPKIPHLAKGGITNGPTMALIGDNPGGQEVVAPLDKLAGIVTSAMISAMKFNKSSNNSVGGDINLNIDGRTFARIIKPYADIENKRVGANIRLQSI